MNQEKQIPKLNLSNLPSAKIIRQLQLYPEFEKFFKELYSKYVSNEFTISQLVQEVQKHNIFINNKICHKRTNELRNYFNLQPKMLERSYKSNSDRIKGYMIRNTKFMAKRRGIHFNLNHDDFELPEYCPLLNIKLTFNKESDGNDLSHASLDRVNNSKGYIKDNVIVLSRLANNMKSCANFEQLEIFSVNILKLMNHYKNQGALGSITDIFPNIKLKT